MRGNKPPHPQFNRPKGRRIEPQVINILGCAGLAAAVGQNALAVGLAG